MTRTPAVAVGVAQARCRGRHRLNCRSPCRFLWAGLRRRRPISFGEAKGRVIVTVLGKIRHVGTQDRSHAGLHRHPAFFVMRRASSWRSRHESPPTTSSSRCRGPLAAEDEKPRQLLQSFRIPMICRDFERGLSARARPRGSCLELPGAANPVRTIWRRPRRLDAGRVVDALHRALRRRGFTGGWTSPSSIPRQARAMRKFVRDLMLPATPSREAAGHQNVRTRWLVSSKDFGLRLYRRRSGRDRPASSTTADLRRHMRPD